MEKQNDREELWQQDTMEGKLAVIHRMLGLEMVLLDFYGEVLAKTLGFPAEKLSLLRNRRQALLQKDDAPFQDMFLCRIMKNSQLLGWLTVAVKPQSVPEVDWQLLKELCHHIGFLLWHEKALRQEQCRHREQFLYDLLYHNFAASEEMIRLGKLWNMHLDRPHHVVVMEFDQMLPGGRSDQVLEELDQAWARFLSARFAQPIRMIMREQLIILLEDTVSPPRSQSEIVAVMKAAMDTIHQDTPRLPAFSIGIGRLRYKVSEICRSFQEARQALGLGRFRHPGNGITCYEDLGVLKLLSHVRSEELDDFSQETLGGLMDYDAQNGTDFLQTLEVYFQENESLPQAAERLFIHVNTLRNRLKKIQSILGVELSQAENRVRFYVACQALRIIRYTKY